MDAICFCSAFTHCLGHREMEEVIASSRTVEIEECYLNLSDPDIEVRQVMISLALHLFVVLVPDRVGTENTHDS